MPYIMQVVPMAEVSRVLSAGGYVEHHEATNALTLVIPGNATIVAFDDTSRDEFFHDLATKLTATRVVTMNGDRIHYR